MHLVYVGAERSAAISKFLIVPSRDWPALQAHQYEVAYGAEYAQHFAQIPIVAIDAAGQLLYDGSGIWAG